MSNRTVRIAVGLLVFVVLIGAAATAFIVITGGSGEASETISAPTLDLSDRATQAPDVEPTSAETTEAVETEDATQVVAATTDEAVEISATEASSVAQEPVVFEIVQEESEVSFTIYEELRGQPKDVIGTTDQVAGQILIDFGNPSASEVGTIRINLRTLVTDDDFRNRAIRGQILRSAEDRYEFTDFVPTAVEGLPDSVTVGEPFKFTLTGDLTLLDRTNPVTFDVTVTPVSENRIEGTAVGTVQRSDYGLTIPSVPSVANVAEDVTLQINFVAEAVE